MVLPLAGAGMMGGMGGMGGMPSMTGGEATSGSDQFTESHQGGSFDAGNSNDFYFGGSGAGLNTGAGTYLPLLIGGGVIALGIVWLTSRSKK